MDTRPAPLWIPGAIVGVFLSASLSAQLTSQITGTVMDPTGNVVVGAELKLVNSQTDVARQTVSNSDGLYTFPLLQPGSYTLTVEHAGFKPVRQTGITIEVAQTARLDFKLELGAVAQSVDVTASQELLDAGVSTIGQVVSSRSVANLPTNGRNPYSFIALAPGVRAPAGFMAPQVDNVSSAFVSINGARPNQNAFYIDGGTNTEGNYNGPTYTPSLDLVEEFKVQTNSFSAEYTNTAGGVVNLVTKSGTNSFHGTVYEFLRNDALDANNFFLNRAGISKSSYKFNQFGGTVGGPIVKNKTFFFFGWEGLRLIQGVTYTNTMPTAAQASGDFSDTFNDKGQQIVIYDPTTTRPNPNTPGQSIRSPFPGNRIPLNRMDPVAVNMLKFLPAPNAPGNPITGTNNFASNASAPTNKNDYSIRLDHHFTDKTTLFGRFSHDHTLWKDPHPYGEGNPASPELGVTEFWRPQGVVDLTHIFSPSFLIDLSSSFNRWGQHRIGPGVGFDETQLGVPSYVLQHSSVPAFPTVNVSGMAGTASAPNTYAAGLFAAGGAAFGINGFNRFEERANVTLIQGRHTFKFGVLFGSALQATGGSGGNGGTYSFTQAITQGPNPLAASATAGFGFASFLLGAAATGNHPTVQVGMNVVNKYTGGYFEDDFKPLPRLTLNLGIRYDYMLPFTERYNHLVNFNTTGTATDDGINLTGGLSFPGVSGVSRYAWNQQHDNFAPRLGFAYDMGSSTVIRGGYGIFFAGMTAGGFNNNAIPNTGFTCSTTMITSTDGGLTQENYLSDPFPTGFCAAPGGTQGLLTNLGQNLQISDRNNRVPYSQQWSFDIQRRLPWDILAEAGYFGNHGSRLFGDLQWNQVAEQFQGLGSQLNAAVPNPYRSIVATGNLSAATVTRNQLLRPFPQFLNVTATASTYGSSIYHALQAKLEKRFSKGFSFLMSYTRSKIIDDVDATTVGFPGGTFASGALQNYNNRRLERAVATFDTPNNFAFSSTYELPFGKGKPFWNRGGMAGAIVGGWQINGILTILSGTPIHIVGGNGNGLFGGTQRPNWSGNDPSLDTLVTTRLNRYFDTSQFTLNPTFTFGNAPREMSNLRAPGNRDLTASLFRNIALGERMHLQVRAEFFNLLNRVQFGLPDANINDTAFGAITSQVNNPRQIQFGLKILF